MYSRMKTLKGSDTEGHQGHTPCMYTHLLCLEFSRACSRKEEHARAMKISWISLCCVENKLYTLKPSRETHTGTRQLEFTLNKNRQQAHSDYNGGFN